MAKIYDKDGVVFLEGTLVDLKIDGARRIYIKVKEKNLYTYTGHECPEDLKIMEKKEFLSKLNSMIESKFNGENNI